MRVSFAIAVVVSGLAGAAFGDVTVTPIPDATSAPAASQEAAISQELAQSQLEAGDWRGVLKTTARLLELKPGKATFNRAAVLEIRAEAFLQLKQNKFATDALELGVKEKDAKFSALCEALSELIEKSAAYQYVPKTGSDHKPISILDMTVRKAAYAALFADEFSEMEKKIEDAKAGTTLTPVIEMAKNVKTVRALDIVVNGSDAKTAPIIKEAGPLAAKRIAAAIADGESAVNRIGTAANKQMSHDQQLYAPMSGKVETVHHYYKPGLTGDDAAQLRSIEGTAERIPEAIATMVAGMGQADLFKGLAAKAGDLKTKAHDVLVKDYSR